MDQTQKKYEWESYPEYIALQQYSRCLGGVLASAPRKLQRKITKPMVKLAKGCSMAFCMAHCEDSVDELVPLADREQMRDTAFLGARAMRSSLLKLRGQVSEPHLTSALELLERFEQGLRERPLPHSEPAG